MGFRPDTFQVSGGKGDGTTLRRSGSEYDACSTRQVIVTAGEITSHCLLIRSRLVIVTWLPATCRCQM